MVRVVATEKDTIDTLLKKFKKAVQKSGILEDLKKHEYFLKKSLRRQQKSKLARRKKY